MTTEDRTAVTGSDEHIEHLLGQRRETGPVKGERHHLPVARAVVDELGRARVRGGSGLAGWNGA